MRLHPSFILFLFLLLVGIPRSLCAQAAPLPGVSDALWSRIEAQLNRQPADTSFQFILSWVSGHCGRDAGCLLQNYRNVMIRLERSHFNLPAAIFVCEEIVKVAHAHKALEEEAEAYQHLCRFHDALGNARLSAFNIERALRLFERTGDPRKILLAKYWKLKVSLRYRKMEEVMPEMEALLSEAIQQQDTGLLVRLHQTLANQNAMMSQYGKMAEHLDALEALVASNPLIENRTRYQMLIAKGRGDLAWGIEHLEEAKRFYLSTLLLSQTLPDHWIEIECLQILAELEWGLGNRSSAKSYLVQAHNLAEERQLDDLLISSFRLASEFAEAEGRYAEALESLKKMRKRELLWENRSSGNNAQNYFLEAENEKRKLELNLKNAQLRYSLLVAFLILLLSAGVFVAYRKLRTDKIKLSEQNALIQQQAEQLKALDTAKSRFFANVSHELRTPLTLLLGPIGALLNENQLTDKQTQLLHIARQSGKQLGQLINDILDLNKLEMSKMEVTEKPTELAGFFRTYFAQFESLAERKQVDFTKNILIDNQLIANIDQEKCRQILFNLLSNAFKFTPAGGKVNVELRMENGQLRMDNGEWKREQPLHSPLSILHSQFYIQVSDSGPGIHPDDLPHLFDRYFQTTRPDKPAEGGTGIGLALCHEYAQLFGGKIEVESVLGAGSVFRVAFPVMLAAVSDKTSGSPTGAYSSISVSPKPLAIDETGGSPRKPTILVVEDNLDLQDYMRLVLQDKYHVVTADHGQAAWECLQPSSVSLILSDLMMPVMDGYQLLEKLKSDATTRHIPTIMLTARAEAADKLKALRIGVDDYLLKPFDEEELLVRIENLLKNQAARHTASANEPEPEVAVPLHSQPDREWLETFENYVRQHLADDTLSVAVLAYEFAMSESTLLRQLKRLTGLSPLQYLLEVRLSEARRLLENRLYNSIAQVASQVGYSDAQSFTRGFKQRFGKLPSEVLGA